MFSDIMSAKCGWYYGGGGVLWFDYFLTAILFWASWRLLNGLLNIRSWKIRNRNRRDLWNKALLKDLVLT